MIRKKFHILVDGDAIPYPITSFSFMKLPPPILHHLEGKGITRPTPIQLQGLPVVYAFQKKKARPPVISSLSLFDADYRGET